MRELHFSAVNGQRRVPRRLRWNSLAANPKSERRNPDAGPLAAGDRLVYHLADLFKDAKQWCHEVESRHSCNLGFIAAMELRPQRPGFWCWDSPKPKS